MKLKRKQKPAAAGAKPKKPAKDRTTEILTFIVEWTTTFLLLLFGWTTLLQSFIVPSGSMEDTVLIGDHMIVDKLSYSPSGPVSRYLLPYTPLKRGDIVVFRYPVNPKENYIKRLIGLPGDRLKVVNKDLYLNGKKAIEPYVAHKSPLVDSYRDNFPSAPNTFVFDPAVAMLGENQNKDGEIVVPPGHYFVMGDNRDNSSDSRYWGFVPRENIVGKPLIVWWSYETTTERLTDPNYISVDHLIDLVTNFFTKTRWKRTLLLLRGQAIETQ
jgi:signal peptidase I